MEPIWHKSTAVTAAFFFTPRLQQRGSGSDVCWPLSRVELETRDKSVLLKVKFGVILRNEWVEAWRWDVASALTHIGWNVSSSCCLSVKGIPLSAGESPSNSQLTVRGYLSKSTKHWQHRLCCSLPPPMVGPGQAARLRAAAGFRQPVFVRPRGSSAARWHMPGLAAVGEIPTSFGTRRWRAFAFRKNWKEMLKQGCVCACSRFHPVHPSTSTPCLWFHPSTSIPSLWFSAQDWKVGNRILLYWYV